MIIILFNYILSAIGLRRPCGRSCGQECEKSYLFSCFCRFLQLVAPDVENESFNDQSVNTINQIKNLINSELYKVIRKVPGEVETRCYLVIII